MKLVPFLQLLLCENTGHNCKIKIVDTEGNKYVLRDVDPCLNKLVFVIEKKEK